MIDRIARSLVPVLAFSLVAWMAACETEPAADEEETAEAAADTVSAEEGLELLRTQYEAAFNAGDWDAVSALLTDDYMEISPTGQVLDRAAADAMMRDTTQMTGGQISIQADTPVADGDVAYNTGVSTFTATGPDGTEVVQEARWLAGFERVDGQWKLDRLMSAPMGPEAITQPAPPAPDREPDTGT